MTSRQVPNPSFLACLCDLAPAEAAASFPATPQGMSCSFHIELADLLNLPSSVLSLSLPSKYSLHLDYPRLLSSPTSHVYTVLSRLRVSCFPKASLGISADSSISSRSPRVSVTSLQVLGLLQLNRPSVILLSNQPRNLSCSLSRSLFPSATVLGSV